MMNALFVASRSGGDTNGKWGPIGRLESTGSGYRFVYTHGARTLPDFQPLAGMPDLRRVYESDDLFPVFKNRLLSTSRPEYEAYLTWSGFDPNQPPDPIAILGVTEGLRQTDVLELFPCPVPDADGCFLTKFFLHGVRWFPTAAGRIRRLKSGEKLALMLDIQNPFDRNAVAVRTMDLHDRPLIGYVPRYLAHDVSHLSRTCEPKFMEIVVVRVNQDAPLQQRVLCQLKACWPEDFEPCMGEEFQPIAGSMIAS